MTARPLFLNSGQLAKLIDPKANEVAFGLDLAGLSGKNSRLAKAQRNQGSGSILVTVFDDLGVQRYRGKDRLEAVTKSWGAIVAKCLESGTLVVDAPLNVQALPAADPRYVWQLTKRSIDYALDGLPPFASWIGHLVSTFRFLVGENTPAVPGDRMLESYPAASLLLILGSPPKSYKKQSAVFSNNSWQPRSGDARKGLSVLLQTLGLQVHQNTKLDDHDLDALLCAVTGLGGAFATTSEELLDEVERRLATKMDIDRQEITRLRLASVPEGYRLLKTMPETIRVEVVSVSSLDELLEAIGSEAQDRY